MWYSDEYRSWRFVRLVSVVVILENTFEFQASRVSVLRVASDFSGGICSMMLRQACSDEINETPTRDLTVVVLKEKTAPSRAVELTEGVEGYCAIPLPALLPSPRKVLYVGSESK
jgi:hypothetical protein